MPTGNNLIWLGRWHMIQIPNKHTNPLIQPEKSTFKKDILDLFLGLKTAHLASHTFEHGAALWEDFFNTPSDYYVVKDEINLIKENAVAIRKIAAGVKDVIDLGPGSAGAVTNKTLPILQNFLFSIENYHAVDVSLDYLNSAKSIIESAFPDLNINLLHKNFFSLLQLPINNRSIALLFGLTLSNMPGIYDKASGINYLRTEMEAFRKILPKGAYFLCSYDTCQDEEKMMRAYDHPKHALFIKNITSKIESDLVPDSGFNAHAWRYNPKWDKENYMFKHILTSTKSMDFMFEDRLFAIPENYDILSYVSVKFPEDIYLKIFSEAGFELMAAPFKGPNGDINITLLRAT
ncbi:MAG: hypothetical protein DI551_11655 [Micavibrio aeruginosavorus]|uniref:Histidine-specific methyltransferase SAM-dependent domain-containing protein n=1 Tax=Micavibrio aeruginosavorus TaxID=349221 RepID=A0A2W5MTJ6_9BACT|nr:MAG: hypothetical protein DI551_11655 [Micavibrio aeruginosavorus]